MDRTRQIASVSLKAPSRRERVTTLAIAVAGDEPPNEFCIFTAGTVDTVKGQFTFDEEAAKSVLAEYAAHGIDLMIDYDHASLGSSADPALAGRAAGWFQLEVRDGALWAVNVRWTEPAAQALRAKEWRFMSPAFQTDGENRIVAIMNVAITNLPATRNLEPLMAASITALSGAGMDPKLISEALDALVAGDDAKCAELLKGIIAAAAGGASDPDANTEDAPPPVGDGGADETQEMAAPPPPPAADPKKEDKTAVAAAVSRITALTGKTTLSAAVEEIEGWRQKALKHDAVLEQAAKEKAVLELSKRKENAITLTRLGAETPHTTGLGLKTPKLCKRLLDEPLDEQNARIAALLSAKGGKLPAEPPVGGDKVTVPGSSVQLTAEQAKICKDTGCDPAVFAQLTSFRDSAKTA